jgi:hypothetical protein
MMKILRLLTVLILASPVLAQNVTCTPDVPRETCQKAGASFALREIKSQIVIADPASFRREKESLIRGMVNMS